MSKRKYLIFTLLAALCLPAIHVSAQNTRPLNNEPQLWLTDPSDSILFKQQNNRIELADKTSTAPVITIDKSKVYQQMDGFGFALTGGSAMLIHQMSDVKQTQLLN